jgi:FkbM family methyltransferase
VKPYPKGNPSDWIRRIARPGDIVIDGGANIGGFSKAAAETVGERGRVYAVEPDPRCAKELEDLTVLHPQVTYVAAALSRTAGCVELHQAKHPAQSSLVLGAVSDPLATLQVAAITLDGLASGAVRAVKLDLQGGEALALYGASDLLTRCPYWCLEFWPWAMRKVGMRSPRAAAEWILWAFANLDFTAHTLADGYPLTNYDDLLVWCHDETHPEYQHINIAFSRV